MKKQITIIFVIFSIMSIAFAQSSSSETSGSDFMRIDGHAASAAMGETGLLRLSSGNAIFDNPAALSETWSLAMTSTYSRWILETNYARFGIALPILRQKLVFGIGGTWLDYGTWDNDEWITTPGHTDQSEVSATDIAGRLGAGWRITHPSKNIQFGIGADAEYAYRSIGDASGGGLGIGGSFFFEPHPRLRLAGKVDRISLLKLSLSGGGASGEEEDLPLTIEGGAKWTAYKGSGTISGVDILASARRFGEDDLTFGGGAEIDFIDRIAFRTGWRSDESIFAPSLGLGLKIPVGKGHLLFDYAYTPYMEGVFEQRLSGHRFTLGLERESVTGFHLLEPIGIIKKGLCKYSCNETGKWRPVFQWTRAGIPKSQKIEERYLFELSRQKDFREENLLVKSILDFDSLAIARWCEYRPEIHLTEGDYHWRVYLVDSEGLPIIGAPENIASFTVWCENICFECPILIESISITNGFFEVDTVTYETWDIPTLPVVFFDRNENTIQPPTEHLGMTNPDWIEKTAPCDTICGSLLTDDYYNELIELLAGRLYRNPDVEFHLSGYSPERAEVAKPIDIEILQERTKKVRDALVASESGITSRVITIDPETYDIFEYRTPRVNIKEEQTSRGDENRRVEIEAIVSGGYGGPLVSTIEELQYSWIRGYAKRSESLLKANPDLILVAEVLVSPANMRGKTRKTRRHNAIDEAMAMSNALAESMRVALPQFSDRIFAWGDTVSQKVCENRVKLFLSPDRITYVPKTRVISIVSADERAKLLENRPTIEVGIAYPCPDSRRRALSWKLEIIPKIGGDAVIDWSGSGPPDEQILIQWDFMSKDGLYVDFREDYVARMTIIDAKEGAISATSERTMQIQANSSKRIDKILITVFNFDRTDPLSRVMEDRLGVVADKFIRDREYQKENQSELWISSDYVFEGHTCQLGARSHNEGLSQRRAEAEREKLIQLIIHDKQRSQRLAKALTVPVECLKERLEREFDAVGYAWDEPLADSRTPEGRTMNRRTYLSMSYSEERMPPGDRQLFWLAQAESLAISGDGAGAISAADSVFVYNPIGEIKARAFRAKADGLRLEGNFGDAAEYYNNSLAIMEDPFTASRLADIYRRLGKIDEAIAVIKPYADEDADAAYTLGETYLSQSEYRLAAEAYAKAVDLRPGIADADCKLLACLILSGQEVDESRRSLEQILKDCRR